MFLLHPSPFPRASLSFFLKKGNQMRKLNTEELKQVYGGGSASCGSASKSASGGSKSGGSKSGSGSKSRSGSKSSKS